VNGPTEFDAGVGCGEPPVDLSLVVVGSCAQSILVRRWRALTRRRPARGSKVYHRPHDPAAPVVCMDEKPYQLLDAHLVDC
jgi:hypothetical protein